MDGSAQLTEVRFSKKRQGYDPDEVDNFLERVGEKVYELQEKIRSTTERAQAAESKVAAAEARAEAAEQEAVGPSSTSSGVSAPAAKSAEAEDLEETLKNTLVLAQRTADTAVREATAEAQRIVAEAQATADKLAGETDATCKSKLDDADRQAQERIDAASGPIKTEVLRLEDRQKHLVDDTTALESHLEAQRARIRDALTTLQSVVDDPTKFATDRRPAATQAPEESAATGPTANVASGPASGSPRPPGASTTGPITSLEGEARQTTPALSRIEPVDARPTATPASATNKSDEPDKSDESPLTKPLASRTVSASAGPAKAPARPTAPPVRPAARSADDSGPATAQIDLTAEPAVFEDNNFLDELRRAVGDGDTEPGGPDDADQAMQAFFEQRDGDLDTEGRKSRFGRRH